MALVAVACGGGSGAGAPARMTAAGEPLPRYDMEVTLAPEQHELRVAGTLVIPPAREPRTSVTVALMDIMTELRIEAEPAAVVTSADRAEQGAGNLDRTLRFARPVPAGQEIAVRFSYASRTASRFVYHIDEDAMFAGGPSSAWYPQIADTKATGTIRYRFPKRYTMIAGGSAAEVVSGEEKISTVRYAKPATFSFIAAELVLRERRGVVPMRVYTLRDRPGIEAYLDGCSRVLEVLTREFGPYPYDGFALVEAPPSATAAAGFSGASFEGFMVGDSPSLDAPFNLAYFGHEIGHQWWGNLVTRRGDEGGYLFGEGLAQYGSLRAVEELDGQAAAETYRRRGYPGYSDYQSGLGYLLHGAAGLDQPVAAPVTGYSPLVHQLANSKGLLALDHLSRVVGRDRFRAVLHEVTRRHGFGTISWDEFVRLVQAHADRDLTATFAQWFTRIGAPDWTVEWTQTGDRVSGIVAQRGDPYDLEVDVQLTGARGQTVVRRVAITGTRARFEVDAAFRVRQLELDPHYTVLHWTPEYRAEAEALVDVTRARARANAGDHAGAAAIYADALTRVPADDRYGVRFSLELGYGDMLRRQDKLVEAKTHLVAAIESPVRPASRLPWAYVLLARIAAAQKDAAALATYAKAATDAEKKLPRPIGAAAAVAALRTDSAAR